MIQRSVASPSQSMGSQQKFGQKTRTPTPNSACSTPVSKNPTPSSTPTPTNDLISDFGMGGKSQSNILDQALMAADIDLESFLDDAVLENECLPTVTPPPLSMSSVLPPKSKPLPPKGKPKIKTKQKPAQMVTMKSNNSVFQQQPQPNQLTNNQGKKVTLSPQQKLIASNGQVMFYLPMENV